MDGRADGAGAYLHSIQPELALSLPKISDVDSIHWREQNMDPRGDLAKKRRRIITGMTGAVVDNQVDARGPAIRMQQPTRCRTKVLAVVFVQALRPYPSL